MKLPDRGRRRGYFINILLGWDQQIGTYFGIDADESISSYVGRNYHGKWQERVIDWIFLHVANESGHCANNIEKEFL
jgi:hypothetical protein